MPVMSLVRLYILLYTDLMEFDYQGQQRNKRVVESVGLPSILHVKQPVLK